MRAYRARRNALPAEMTAARRWVQRDGKRPVRPNGAPASSTKSWTWSRRDEVSGPVGFVLGRGSACLDLDHCLDGGTLAPWAAEVVAAHPDAYVEVSPSGTGLHVWGRAPESRGWRRGGVEAYSSGRYITVTGRVWQPGGLTDLSGYFQEV